MGTLGMMAVMAGEAIDGTANAAAVNCCVAIVRPASRCRAIGPFQDNQGAVSLPENYGRLTRKLHHRCKKVPKSFREPVTVASLTQEVTGDFANDRM
jgi:hypothetical protein